MTDLEDRQVLIVDDEHVFLRLINLYLKKIGFKKIIATDDGKKALQLLNSNKIDLIICDWHMPQMDGVALYQEIKNNPKLERTPFIMLTSEHEKSKIAEAMQLGIINYIFKPFDPEQLEMIIKGLLNLL